MEAVVELWRKCNLTRPWNDPVKDIELAIASPNSTVLVGKIDAQIVASAMVGHDGHRGSLYYVAINPEFQKLGLGKALIRAAEEWLKQRGVWKINILIRDDNLGAAGFYEAIGFERNQVISMGRRLA